jgi:hypothetical protein
VLSDVVVVDVDVGVDIDDNKRGRERVRAKGRAYSLDNFQPRSRLVASPKPSRALGARGNPYVLASTEVQRYMVHGTWHLRYTCTQVGT